MDLGSRNLPNLVSGKELAQCYGECKRLELIIHARQAGGRAASGRLKKHDSARLKCLQREVYPDLRIGKMPTELVWKMLWLPGPLEISGPAEKDMDRWAQIYVRLGVLRSTLELRVSQRWRTLLPTSAAPARHRDSSIDRERPQTVRNTGARPATQKVKGQRTRRRGTDEPAAARL